MGAEVGVERQAEPGLVGQFLVPVLQPRPHMDPWSPQNPWVLNIHRTEVKCPVERDRFADEEKNTSREKERGRMVSLRIIITPSPRHRHFLD